MSFSGCLSDSTFGAIVQGCRADFDFTLTFERIFFSLVPASLFIAAAIIRSLWLIRRPTVVRGCVFFVVVKAGMIVSYAALRIALLVLSSVESGRQTPLFAPSTALEVVAALAVLSLSLLEHSRSPRPSIILNAYLLLTLLFDIVQTRSLQVAAVSVDEKRFASILTAATAVKAVLVLTESQHKSRWLLQKNSQTCSPEDTSGLYSLGTFLWLNKLFWRGYKKVLAFNDLLPLGQTMATEDLRERLGAYLRAHPTRGRNYGLAKAIARVLVVPLLLPVAPRIALIGFSFCQPFLINAVLHYLEGAAAPESSSRLNSGYGLIGATIVIYFGIAISTAFYRYLHERALWMARGALSNAIYNKAIHLRADTGNSAVLTLMSTDIERIRIGFKAVHDFWACIIEMSLASWLLFSMIGSAFAATLVIVAICLVCIGMLALLGGTWQRAWMEEIQKRVGVTSNMIANMKHLKISGLTGPVESLVQKLRTDEIKAGSKWRTIIILASTIGFFPIILGPVLTFALTARELDVARLFTSLSFLTFLTTPLTQSIQFIPPFLASFTCLERIQAFLEKDARLDFRESSLTRVSEKHYATTGGMRILLLSG
ncbi:ABC transporter FGM5 [Cladobotryum mycophilum]|uniref:ABC transporter FGM5 n=1 Tax=Cladobotryum mycophilum TaxID=491253 RepID=A0ABR0SCB4_9HYPO